MLALVPGVASHADPVDTSAHLPAASDRALHMRVAVEINGKGPFHFVVDTGADRSVLADSTAQALGLAVANPVLLAGIVRTVPAQTVDVANIAFGPVRRENLRLPVLPRSELEADGYLGIDLIQGTRVILDFKNSEIIVSDPLPAYFSIFRQPGITVLPATGNSGHLRMARCRVNRHGVAAFVDTGAQSTMGNEALYRMLLEDNPETVSRGGSIELIGLTGGSAVGHLITPHLAEIGTLSIMDAPIAIADLQVFTLWEVQDRPALLIGMNWLRQFHRVSIDYGQREIRFELGRSSFTFVA